MNLFPHFSSFQIFGTSKMVSFVNILQDLLSIETVYSKNA